ncbi:MAG: hypothetical protein ACTHOF_06285 [Flavisolibacter sp.]
MKKFLIIVSLVLCFGFLYSIPATAQCSICTRTAQQLGEKSAKGLNAGIMYLAFTPLVMVGIIGYRWWRKNR